MDPLWVLTFISHLEHLPDYLEKRGVGGLIVTSYAVTRLLCKSRNMLLMIFCCCYFLVNQMLLSK